MSQNVIIQSVKTPLVVTPSGFSRSRQEVRVVHGLVKDENGQRHCPMCLTVCPEGKAERYIGEPGNSSGRFEMFCAHPDKSVSKSNRQEKRQNKYPRLYMTCDQYQIYAVMSE